jgi:hypothetical protein
MSSTTAAAKSKMTALTSFGRVRLQPTPHQKYLKRKRADEAREAKIDEMRAFFTRYDADLVEFKAGRMSLEEAKGVLANIREEKALIQQVIDQRHDWFEEQVKKKELEAEDEPKKKKAPRAK